MEKHEWGNVLKRYFINSKGAAILIDESTPLYTSIREQNGRQLCLKGSYDNFPYVNRIYPLPHLNYSICTSSNMTK